MDSSVDEDTTLQEFLSFNSSYTHKGDLNISDHIADFQRMRISALTKAAELSPLVKEATIGPNSRMKKEVPLKLPEPEKEEYLNEETLIEDKIREDLRFTLIMKDYEAKLQQASETIFNSLIEKMTEKRAETIERCRQKLLEENKKKMADCQKLQLLKEVYANENFSILEAAKLEEQQYQILNRQRVENMNRVLEEQNKATARFAAITDSHTRICICYNQIMHIFNSETITSEVYNNYVSAINAVIVNIGTVMDKCNLQLTTDKEVKQAEVLALNIENIKKKIKEEVEAIKQEIIAKEQQEELRKQKELDKKKLEEKKAEQQPQQQAISLVSQQSLSLAPQATTSQDQQAQRSIPVFYSPKNYNYYTELKNFLVQYEAQYKDLLENPNLKKFRFDCQKAVNTPVNAISSVSGSHMKDKYDKLYKLLKGERVQVLDTFVTASQHPQGVAYCTALLAKKIVRQGDLLVSSKPEAAFPLAAITVALWSQFSELGTLLEANFDQLCPYLVPMFLPQKQNQTDKDFYLSRGYIYSDTGAVEKQDKFLKRMSGIFRLRCAIWIAKMPKILKAHNPHSLQYGWQWLASFINLKPEPDICATLLHDFFIVCGSEFIKHYGRQFTKIIKLINTEYLAVLQNIDEGGPKTRLEVFLQNVLRTGHIQPPTGLLPLNMW